MKHFQRRITTTLVSRSNERIKDNGITIITIYLNQSNIESLPFYHLVSVSEYYGDEVTPGKITRLSVPRNISCFLEQEILSKIKTGGRKHVVK